MSSLYLFLSLSLFPCSSRRDITEIDVPLRVCRKRRKQADQVYLLGINRRATPLDRLKRSHLDFQARMLVAPPIPSPPRTSTGTSSTVVRPILSSSSSSSGGGVRPIVGGGATTSSGTGVGPKVANGGSMFAVFKDESAAAAGGLGTAGQEAEWQDFGTVKSRKRENDSEKKEWSGETMPQGLPTPAPAFGGGFKLEVYRDEVSYPHLFFFFASLSRFLLSRELKHSRICWLFFVFLRRQLLSLLRIVSYTNPTSSCVLRTDNLQKLNNFERTRSRIIRLQTSIS